MKKILKIVGIIIGILIVLFVLTKLDNLRVKHLRKNADIYIEYVDGAIWEKPLSSGKYALINIEKNKLYIINWERIGFDKIYKIGSRNITDSETNDLLNKLQETKESRLPTITNMRLEYNI